MFLSYARYLDVKLKKGKLSLPLEYKLLKTKLENAFEQYHAQQKLKKINPYELNNLSGVEFETWIAKILKENSFDVRGTPATGDQGADLIAQKNGKTIIIQAKRYQGTVGNKAVQEVIAAVKYYNGDAGCVITNSTFTESAKALAGKASVKLIDGTMLRDISQHIAL
jgi:HJR/Mrr/RecB family endonuclease